MKKYIETLGRIIEGRVEPAPDQARMLLMAAYSWVRFSGGRKKPTSYHNAYDRLNSAVADTIVSSFRRPQESVMVNIFYPCEVLHAMGVQPMFPEGISAYVACTACQNVFGEAAEARDVPETFCSYHKTMLGLAETGVMPKPLMIANTTLACDANQLSFRRLAEFYDVPHAVIDIPDRDDDEAVAYVAGQLRDAAAMMEELLGRKLEMDALRETVARSQRTIDAYLAYLKRRGEISLPTTMTGELCSMIASHVMLGRPESEEYINSLLRIARETPDGWPKERKRIFWMHILPNWQDSMKDILEESGRCEIVGTDIAIDGMLEMDPDRPFESMARRVVGSINNGPGIRRVEASIRAAKHLRADGTIVFCHWGCKQTMGLSQLAKQAMEAEGLPTLVLDGDGCDSRNVADGQMVTRVNAFLEQLEGLSQ